MKKYLLLLAAAVFTFTACTEDEGTTPGGDGQPKAVLYTYDAELPNDPDLDCALRIAVNNKTQEVYYLGEKTEAYDQHIAEMGEKGYIDYIVANGTKIEGVSAAEASDVIVKNLAGDCKIAVVAASASKRTLSVASFMGYTWTTVCKGTYYFGYGNAGSVFGFASVEGVELQYKDAEPSQYRFKNLFAPGYSLSFTKTNIDSGDGGKYVRVSGQATPFTFGSYGTLNVRDVATWQGSDNFLDNVLYDDGYCYLWLQWYVSAGNTGYAYDEFYPEGMEPAEAPARRGVEQ